MVVSGALGTVATEFAAASVDLVSIRVLVPVCQTQVAPRAWDAHSSGCACSVFAVDFGLRSSKILGSEPGLSPFEKQQVR